MGVTSGVHERARLLAATVLLLGYSTAVACSADSVVPTAPSPGLDSARPVRVTPAPTASSRTTPGIELTVVPKPDGSFDVIEKLTLPTATDMLPLQLPASGAELPGMMSPTTPQVTNLQVFADDQSVPLENTTLPGADYVPLTIAAARIRLTYRLSGSAVLATPSRTGRASAAIRPLTASTAAGLPTDLTVTSGLLNAVCPLLPEPRCAVGDPPHLAVKLGIPAGKALVVLQLDLPR
ncbi:hypothetical protein [Kribbella sp.]|uniref:hypothetical protein n=1 Tax=Kribbella sp. TaxID=1871183 RepID=UPI002D397DCB|nr:hypothetical protein [Kribbella sp.]HZX03375.1 hypothetical protein [Kribbella sp.]